MVEFFEDYQKNNGVYYKLDSNYFFEDKYILKINVANFICFSLVPNSEKTFNEWISQDIIDKHSIDMISIQANGENILYSNGSWEKDTHPIKINTSYSILIISLQVQSQDITLNWSGRLIKELVIKIPFTSNTGLFISSCVTSEVEAQDFLDKQIRYYFEDDIISKESLDEKNYMNKDLSLDDKKKLITEINTIKNNQTDTTTRRVKGVDESWFQLDMKLKKNIGLIISTKKDALIGTNRETLEYIIVDFDNSGRIKQFISEITNELDSLEQKIYY